MMKKWKEIKDKPVTWGGYAKLCAVSMLISIPMSILSVLVSVYSFDIVEFVDDIKNIFKR